MRGPTLRKPVTVLAVRIPEELANKLRFIATQENRSMSSAVRILIRRHIEEFEEENGKIVI